MPAVRWTVVEPTFLGTDLEASQERLVEDWLANHPWSTTPEIRAGIALETGWEFERIQSRITGIQKRRVVEGRWRKDAGVKEFRLGEVRPSRRKKAFGLESKVFIGEEPVILIHQSDIDDPRVAAQVEALRVMVEDFVATRILPLVEHRVGETPEQKADREFLELLQELSR